MCFQKEGLLEESSAGHVFGSDCCRDGGREVQSLCSCAAACGELELVEQLLEFTSDDHLAESMSMAKRNGEAEIEDLLLKYTGTTAKAASSCSHRSPARAQEVEGVELLTQPRTSAL